MAPPGPNQSYLLKLWSEMADQLIDFALRFCVKYLYFNSNVSKQKCPIWKAFFCEWWWRLASRVINTEKGKVDNNGYPLNFIKSGLGYQNSQPPPTTNGETVPPTWWALPYVKHVSELNARHLHPFNFSTAHKPTKSLRGILVNVKDPLPTM